MTEHQQKADSLERDVAEMQERSERLKEEISDVREDWENKRRDESVPGAPTPESGLPPEANYTTSGDRPPQDGEEQIPSPEPDETD
jgi:hypothetical protein